MPFEYRYLFDISKKKWRKHSCPTPLPFEQKFLDLNEHGSILKERKLGLTIWYVYVCTCNWFSDDSNLKSRSLRLESRSLRFESRFYGSNLGINDSNLGFYGSNLGLNHKYTTYAVTAPVYRYTLWHTKWYLSDVTMKDPSLLLLLKSKGYRCIVTVKIRRIPMHCSC